MVQDGSATERNQLATWVGWTVSDDVFLSKRGRGTAHVLTYSHMTLS